MIKINNNVRYLLGALLGIAVGWSQFAPLLSVADVGSTIFLNLLRLVSLPIIFLSIVSTASGMEGFKTIQVIGRRVLTYTLLTTIIAAAIALALYLIVDPVRSIVVADQVIDPATASGYWGYLMGSIPSNFIQPFYENHVIGVLVLAMLLSFAILSLPDENKHTLHHLFTSLYKAVMKITQWIIALMPIAVFSFVALFVRELTDGLEWKSLLRYLTIVVGANLVQAFVILPLFLLFKGISPRQMARAMMPALSVAFFSKSSSAALPLAMQCAEERGGISRTVSSFSFPLCTTINMNACAAFILTTVLYVSMSHGITFTYLEMFSWIFIATIAAVGNAGVPMGCYFLASAFLVSMNVPLGLMGMILPVYSLIDMLESAINVWSDSCVAAAVEADLKQTLPAVENTSY